MNQTYVILLITHHEFSEDGIEFTLILGHGEVYFYWLDCHPSVLYPVGDLRRGTRPQTPAKPLLCWHYQRLVDPEMVKTFD